MAPEGGDRTHHGTQVARVGHPVERDDQGQASCLRVAQDLPHGFVVERVLGQGATARVSIIDSFASGNTHGFLVNAQAGGVSHMSAMRVTGAGNVNGARVAQSGGVATAVIAGGLFTANTNFGLDNGSSGTLKTPGDNLVDLNGTNTNGPISALTPQ